VLLIGLTMEREALYRRVDARVDRMLAQGLVDEVRGLVRPPPAGQGYDWALPALSSLGYAQLRGYLEDSASLDECIDQIKHDTHRFIRQQYAWFRAMEKRHPLYWLDLADAGGALLPGGALLRSAWELIQKELDH
jgi:tRNA dimethylallyltransferase